ncbi:hypothetical protein TorRG33x02_327730 [Trema orientale]|uniref:Uncharacterized protein n=1 Tax=Trema orientale TaxID=63057 RepID=A0A2P5BAP5_TREOI|nr:hypothetical protein TorRG33x02_327730 [Trema orientale]
MEASGDHSLVLTRDSRERWNTRRSRRRIDDGACSTRECALHAPRRDVSIWSGFSSCQIG